MTLFPSMLKGVFAPPYSKSYAQRVIIASLLADKPTEIKNLPSCGDVDTVLGCAKALGGMFDGGMFIPPAEFNKKAVFDCGESGLALRFFMPVAAAVGGEFTFEGSDRLFRRPSEPLIQALRSGGVTVGRCSRGYNLSGRLRPGSYEICCGGSSQFLSGMLMALAVADGPSTVKAVSLASAPYVGMTADVMKEFGVSVNIDGNVYTVFPSVYSRTKAAEICMDWSGAAFLLSGAAICGKVTVKPADNYVYQGDRAIVGILEKFGADVETGKNSVTVAHRRLRGITLDCTDIPDLVPAVAAVAAYADGTTVLKNTERLAGKESNRVEAVTAMINSLGCSACFSGGDIVICGGAPAGGRVGVHGDHRIAMAAAVAAAGCSAPVIIDDAECVKKSYPRFWEDYAACGGKTDFIADSSGGKKL